MTTWVDSQIRNDFFTTVKTIRKSVPMKVWLQFSVNWWLVPTGWPNTLALHRPLVDRNPDLD